MTKITFIIPSVGRISLVNALQSLISQDNPDWLAVVIFDGVPKDSIRDLVVQDNRISYLHINKKIGVANHAGEVRNIGIKHAKTEWCGFLDDDDRIVSNYVSHFYDTIEKYKDVEVIQWRMIGEQRDYCLPDKSGEIRLANIGISQSVKTSILLENPFIPSFYEDFVLLYKLNKLKKKIMISDKETYLVRTAKYKRFNFEARFYNFD